MSTEQSSKTGWPTKLFIVAWIVVLLAVIGWFAPEFWKDAVDYYEKAVVLAEKGRTDEALEVLSRAIKMDPENTGYLVTQGNIQLEMEDYPAAEETFRAVIDLAPEDSETVFGLVEVSRRQSQKDSTLEWLNRLGEMVLTPAQALRRARIYADMNEQAVALQCIQDLLVAQPDNPDLLWESASLKSALEDFAGAAKDYAHLADVAKDDARRLAAGHGLAVSFRALKNPQEAYRAFQLIASTDNLQERAELASELGLHDEAIILYVELLAGDDDRVENIQGLSVIYESVGQYLKAVPLLEQLQQKAPDDVNILKIANLLRWGGEPAKSITYYNTYIEAVKDGDPALASPAYEGAAQALLELDDGQKALEYIKTPLENDPENQDYLLLAARAAGQIKDPDLTVSYLERLVKARHLERDEWIWLAGQYRLASRKTDALLLYEKLMSDESVDAEVEVIVAVGDLRADFGQYAKALEAYAMISRKEDVPEYYLKVGRAAENKGLVQMAVEAYGKHLEANSTDLEARLALASLMILQGRGDEAVSALTVVQTEIQNQLQESPEDEKLLLLTARAASMTADPAAAVEYLRRLGALRPLSFSEKIWLAGETRASEETETAWKQYEALYEEAGADFDVPSLEALGDLRGDYQDYSGSLEVYQKIDKEDWPPKLALKMARVAARQADKVELAVGYYTEYLKEYPDDTEAQLEAARIFINLGRVQESLVLYEAVAAARGKEGLGLEVARAYLAAQQFDKAEEWSRFAIEEDEENWLPHLCLAQALHLQGKPEEADDIIDEYREELSENREGLEWLGLVAIARDRHLEAFRIFDRLVKNEDWARRKYWIWRARAAQKLGDFARAKESLKEAAAFQQAEDAGTMESAEQEADAALDRLRQAEEKGRQ